MFFNLLAAAPWQISTDSPILLGIVAGVVGFVLLLFVLTKVPLSYNVLNLAVRWKTALLTAFAFTLVVCVQTVFLAFINGMYAMTESSGHPGNVMIMAEGATDEAFSSLAFADATDLETQEGVLREDGQPLVSRETYLNAVQTLTNPPPGRPRRRFLQVRGVELPEKSARVHSMRLGAGGSWFSEAGVRAIGKQGETAIEVVLGAGIARELGADRHGKELVAAKNRNQLEVEDTFDIGDRLWIVTGIMEQTGSLYDSEVWTKQSQIGPLFGKPNYSTFVLRADPNFRKDQRETFLAAKKQKAQEDYDMAVALKKEDPTAPTPIKQEIKTPKNDDAWGAELVRDYFANEYTKAQINPQVETTYFSNMSATNMQFLIATIVLSLIMSLGGIFGVMNTMFAAISQRTKDIGVLRLLGYKRWQILVSFLLESIVLSIVGGLIGCAIGSLCDGLTASSIVSGGQGGGKSVVLRMTVDASTLTMGMLLSILMGLIGGLIPSLSAMRLTALEALR